MKILIDNGHGVDTPGKRSPDGKLREYAWNRLIASRVVAALTDLGHDAQLLVPEQEDISLSERCRRVNAICQALGTRNVILISIHANALAEATAGMMPPAGAPTPRGATPGPMPWPPACMKRPSSTCPASVSVPTTPMAIRTWRPTSTSSAIRFRLQSLWRTFSWTRDPTATSSSPPTASSASSTFTSTASAATSPLRHRNLPHFPRIPHFPHTEV